MRYLEWPKDREAVVASFATSDAPDAGVQRRVDEIIAAVGREGDRVLSRYTQKFDKVTIEPGDFEISKARMAQAWETTPGDLKRALKTAHRRIRDFHRTQRLKGWTVRDRAFGRIDQRVRPLDRVAVYVPAGEAPLISTVLMTAVPAKVAGVKEVVMLTPPARDGWPDPAILGAAHLAGVDRAFRLGSAWAVAAVALGTETVPRVDKVVGPGNPYVTVAKQRLYGRIGIDSPAGPSEVLVIADAKASLRYVAADMLAQAEHTGDNPVVAVLIGGGKSRARALEAELERQIAPLQRSLMARRSLDEHGWIISVKTAAQAVELANRKAPEHLLILAEKGRELADQIRHAGAIFLGPWSPVALGDYAAGPNHTLPTAGAARAFSPLGVWDFYKTSHVIEATRTGLAALGGTITTLAEAESLSAHAASVRTRLDDEREGADLLG